jgi:8-oxo-dGTP pyrophosphatase MutT (NUDIX family)
MKILLKKGEKFLFLKNPHGKFDLPGGRIDESERRLPFDKVIAREVSEELGPDLRYRLGPPLFLFRRFFPERNWAILILVFAADFREGGISLSEEHVAMEWINPAERPLIESEFFDKEEFEAFKAYFSQS